MDFFTDFSPDFFKEDDDPLDEDYFPSNFCTDTLISEDTPALRTRAKLSSDHSSKLTLISKDNEYKKLLTALQSNHPLPERESDDEDYSESSNESSESDVNDKNEEWALTIPRHELRALNADDSELKKIKTTTMTSTHDLSLSLTSDLRHNLHSIQSSYSLQFSDMQKKQLKQQVSDHFQMLLQIAKISVNSTSFIDIFNTCSQLLGDLLIKSRCDNNTDNEHSSSIFGIPLIRLFKQDYNESLLENIDKKSNETNNTEQSQTNHNIHNSFFKKIKFENSSYTQHLNPALSLSVSVSILPPINRKRQIFTPAEAELLILGKQLYGNSIVNPKTGRLIPDWITIQNRFLPAKTIDQIIIKDKNMKQRGISTSTTMNKANIIDSKSDIDNRNCTTIEPSIARKLVKMTDNEYITLKKGVEKYGTQWWAIRQEFLPQFSRKDLRRLYISRFGSDIVEPLNVNLPPKPPSLKSKKKSSSQLISSSSSSQLISSSSSQLISSSSSSQLISSSSSQLISSSSSQLISSSSSQLISSSSQLISSSLPQIPQFRQIRPSSLSIHQSHASSNLSKNDITSQKIVTNRQDFINWLSSSLSDDTTLKLSKSSNDVTSSSFCSSNKSSSSISLPPCLQLPLILPNSHPSAQNIKRIEKNMKQEIFNNDNKINICKKSKKMNNSYSKGILKKKRKIGKLRLPFRLQPSPIMQRQDFLPLSHSLQGFTQWLSTNSSHSSHHFPPSQLLKERDENLLLSPSLHLQHLNTSPSSTNSNTSPLHLFADVAISKSRSGFSPKTPIILREISRGCETVSNGSDMNINDNNMMTTHFSPSSFRSVIPSSPLIRNSDSSTIPPTLSFPSNSTSFDENYSENPIYAPVKKLSELPIRGNSWSFSFPLSLHNDTDTMK